MTLTRRVALAAVLAVTFGAATAEEADPARELLDQARTDLVELRFEQALAALDDLLEEPGLAAEQRAEALDLRAEVHVAVGQLDRAEADWRKLLELRPAFTPDPDKTPKKARERFEKLHGALIGRWVPRIEPPEARIEVDGQEAARDAEGTIPLVAGEHRVRVVHDGFDPVEHDLAIEPGKATESALRLVPNARTVVLRTDQPGVEVRVDGVAAGTTSFPATAELYAAEPVPELTLANLALGEHVFEFAKPCFSTESRRDQLAVDLLDLAPKRYDVVRMKPARGQLVLRGGPDGAGVLVDGEPAGSLPRATIEACPGTRSVVVSHGGRRIWVSAEPLAEAEERVVEISPRPNVMLVGTGELPEAFAGLARLNRIEPATPVSAFDFSNERNWSRLEVPADVDLVVGISTELWLYSPSLGVATPLGSAPNLSAPSWTRAAWGFTAVDSRNAGKATVVEVAPGGAAAGSGLAPGDRIVAAGGIDVDGAEALRRVLAVASPSAPLDIRWQRRDGTQGQARLTARVGPDLRALPGAPAEAMLRAAWAAVDGAARAPETASAALANLALLQSAFGRHDAAVETWKRVSWEGRAGVGQATAQYHLARALRAAGRGTEASAALRAAAASQAAAFEDDGLEVAPAARAHLAELGSSAH